MVRYVGDDGRRRPGPRGAPRGGRRRPGAGLGGRVRRRRRRRRRSCRAALKDDVPRRRRRRRAPARRAAGRGRRCSPRTPASSPRCWARSGADVEAPAAATSRAAAAETYDAVVLLKGRRTRRRAPRRPGPRQHHRHRVAGDGRCRRRARRRDRRAAGRRSHAVRRRLGRRLAARRGRDAGLRRRARWSRARWRAPCPRRCAACSPDALTDGRIDLHGHRARRDRGRPGRDPSQRAHPPGRSRARR